MPKNPLAVVVVLAGLAWSLASPCAAADSVRILRVTPSGGLFPIEPAMATATVAYVLESAPYAAIVAAPEFPAGAFQLGATPKIRMDETWVSKGRGEATVKFNVSCAPPIPSGAVSSIIATLWTSQTLHGPLSIEAPSSVVPWHGICACSGPSDLTSSPLQPISVGNHKLSWGGTVALQQSDSSGWRNGRCAFDIAHVIVNSGHGPALGPFVNRFTLDAAGTTIASYTVQSLAPGDSRSAHTPVGLVPGTHTVRFAIDAGNAVPEANEGNNQFQFAYTLTGTCQ